MKMISTSCGLGSWRPQWLQRFATRRMYISIYCIIGMIHGMLFSYFSTILSTIEKKFGLKSQEIAWVYSGNEISQAFFLLALPFMGIVRKRTLFMGVSIILSGVGIILCGIPHFFEVEPSYPTLRPNNYLCLEESSPSICSTKSPEETSMTSKWLGVCLIFFGIFLHGIGASFYNSFGIPYIDDNSAKTKSPLALSFVFAAKMGGPFFGSVFASLFLKVNEYPEKSNEMLGFDEKDDRWIGAWWLGFFIFGPILIVVAPLLILFPEQLPRSDGEKIDKESVFAVETPETASEWWDHTKSLVSRLLKNKIYIFNLCSNIAFLFGFMGFITFLPKFIKFNFRKSSSSSGLAGGASNLISSAIGIMTSGWVITKYKLKARSLAMWCVVADVVGILFFIGAIFIGCTSINFLPPCETDCYCTDTDYLPICSLNGAQQFLSPCFAGCTSSFVNDDGKTIYENCSCIEGNSLKVPDVSNISYSKSIGGDGIIKYCEDESCGSQFIIFMSILGLFGILGTSTRIPNLIITLRAIDPKDKAAALTLSVSLLSLFAFLPATVVFGYIIDKTCVVWKTQECTHEEASCLVYDNSSMRLYSGIFMSVFIGIEAFFDLLVWYYSKDLIVYEEEELTEKNHPLLKMT
ncbi:solute carrier organic anion transporter family member 74D [Lepeophtheirus salmonis]|uniref:solute carrier organic anion transporter family member 74D n=1 Tax=Lepeophtheirus salmonis TaxID=72036 RepID=UPI001AEA01EE|nr:solute carrier organic anion transporter family member 74D-like [Lepeophtheirus salmonis]